MLRFVVQWVVSERLGRSTIPVAFWYLSLAGGVMLCVYAILKRDPVFTLGQALGVGIYARNLMLIRRRQSRYRGLSAQRRSETDASADLGEPDPLRV